MFTVTLFTIAKLRKKPRCPTTVEWIQSEILSFAGKLIEMQNIILSKLAKLRRPMSTCFFSYVEYRPKKNTAILQITSHAKRRSQTREGG
jgi:hypothetical protein